MINKLKTERKVRRAGSAAENSVTVNVSFGGADGRSGQLSAEWLRVLLAFPGIFGSVFSFITAFDSGCSYKTAAWTVIISWIYFSAAFVFARRRRTKGLFYAMTGAALLFAAVFLYRYFEELKFGFCEIANRYLARVHEQYRETPFFDMTGFSSERSAEFCIDLAVCTAAMLIAFVVCGAVIKRTNIVLVFLVTFPPPELALYFGLVPWYPAYIMTVACWAALLACEIAELSDYRCEQSGRAEEYFRRTSAQSGFYAAVILISAFVIALVGGAAFGYERPSSADAFRTGFTNYMETFTWKKFASDIRYYLFPGKGGAVHDGRLGSTAEVEFTGDEMLRVTLPAVDYTVYLKGYTGVDYVGYRWEEASEQSGNPEPKLDTSMTSNEFLSGRILPAVFGFEELELRDLTIKNIGMSASEKYYPVNSAGMLEVSDNGRRYGVYFPENGDWRENIMDFAAYSQLSGTLLTDEEKMREYAYSYCLDVPETFTAYEDFFEGYSGGNVSDDLAYIRSRLASECVYDLNAGKMPFGEDFAQWFLSENKKGSCTHFASAAVLLCRSQGIPARYCEGYVIKPDDMLSLGSEGDIVTAALSDCRAHAWIEVYIDNYGWLSCEMTPGYGNVAYSTADIGDEPYGWETAATEIQTEVSEQTEEITTVTDLTSAGSESGDSTTVTITESGAGTNVSTETAHSENDPSETVTSAKASATGISGEGEATEKVSYDYTDGEGSAYVTVTGENGEMSLSLVGTAGSEISETSPQAYSSEKKSSPVVKKVLAAAFKVLMFILGAAAAAGMVILRRRLILLRRTKQIAEDCDNAARAVYMKLCSAAAYCREGKNAVRDPDPERLPELLAKVNGAFAPSDTRVIVNTALKARFGGGITPEEALASAKSLNRIYGELLKSRTDGKNKAVKILIRFSAVWIFCRDRYI
ncbi:MAG: transglutaminase family protein [Huintestinicola sp.]